MKCWVCGGSISSTVTDLPFKVRPTGIVILKEVPAVQCDNCTEFLIEDDVMERVDALLKNANTSAELEIIRYPA